MKNLLQFELFSVIIHLHQVIEQKETKDFKLVNNEKSKTTYINKPCINNVNTNDTIRKKDVNAFICIQPSMQIKQINYNSQPLFKLTFDSL